MAEVPTWAEMLGRAMAVAFDTAVGTMTWSDPDEDPPGHQGSLRFWHAQPDRWRIEDERGPFVIAGRDGTFVRRPSGAMAQLPGESGVGLPHDPRDLLDGRGVAESLSERNDFSRPVGPGRPAQIGGRVGWRFVLAPPPHKPAPLEVVLDDQTGVVLEYRSQGADYWETLTSFEVDVPIDEDRFTWTGEVDTEWNDERQAAEDRSRAVSDHPWPSPRWWPTGMPLDVLDGDVDEGWFIGWLGDSSGRVLARWRPDSAVPRRLAGRIHELPFEHRWQRDGWDWLLATDEQLAPDDLQRIIESIPPG